MTKRLKLSSGQQPLRAPGRTKRSHRVLRIVAALSSIPLLTTIAPAAAVENTTPLHPYVLNGDGSYGYDTAAEVPLYKGATETVSIPDTYTEPKEQFRSSWVATIFNLHFARASSEADFRAKYDTLLNRFVDWNMNAVMFQVRPQLDAYYPSEINPWSEYVTSVGQQGVDPGYDPLAIMVEETHKRGLEYHAWLNPYRVNNLGAASYTAKLGKSVAEINAMTVPQYIDALQQAGVLAANNYAVLHPDHVLRYNERLFLNPGEPEVMAHIAASVKEIVERYDVDAIHFDDYFYPSTDGVVTRFEDRATFERYGLNGNGASYPDTNEGWVQWRRDSVTSMVTGAKAVIDAHNSARGTSVQFGISPGGIWDHKEANPLGSNTPLSSGAHDRKGVYADTRSWVKNEYVDYLLPQLYWTFSYQPAPYGELARWWNGVADGSRTQMYIGHGNYKHTANGPGDPAWMNPEEIPHQMAFNQTLEHVSGSAFYSFNDIVKSDLAGLNGTALRAAQAKNDSIDLLQQSYFHQPALVPAKPWLSKGEVAAPATVTLQGGQLSWDNPAPGKNRYFAIYAGDDVQTNRAEAATALIKDPKHLVTRLWAGDAGSMTFDVASSGVTDPESKLWVVTALDAAGVESAPTREGASREMTVGEVKIAGEAIVGRELTAETSGWLPDTLTLNYQWLRNGEAIADATKRNYLLSERDAGTRVSVRVTADLNNVSGTSVESDAVLVRAVLPTPTEDPDPKPTTPGATTTSTAAQSTPQLSNTGAAASPAVFMWAAMLLAGAGALFGIVARVRRAR